MIPAELHSLLEPLERFESIRRKAGRLGDRLADLSYANPYDGVQQQAREVLHEALDSERLLDLQYSPFGGKTRIRRAIADSLRERHGQPFKFSDVICTPGAMAGLQLALRAAGGPGDEVLIPVPCWLDYHLYVRSLGMVPVSVPLSPQTFDLDPEAVEAAISGKTCAIVFSQPSNPTGRSYTKNALRELTQTLGAAEERLGAEITLISDETHRDFVREGEFVSPSVLWDRTLIVYSFGKYHFMQGQRLGYVAVCPDHPSRKNVADELVSWTRITGFCTPNSLMQNAVPRLLELRYPQDWLEAWRGRFVTELSALGYPVTRPEATLFVYVRTPQPYDDFEFVQKLAASGLLVLPAPVFQHGGHFRLSLTGSERMMEQALTTLGRFSQ